ncbi:SCO family protein [Fodinicurvata halophila]|uniref:SCO family protein n=1 Tax=Fodinicurvata halophila TaxID=1419723 RepID=A0ABV8UHY0_9PROT
MKVSFTIVLALLVMLAGSVSLTQQAHAHSPENLGSMMGDKEKFFEPVDKEVLGFALHTADGETVRLDNLRGRVVVLHFIYASCPDVCPLHAEKITEIQQMVNQTPMKAQVQFVTITPIP